MNTYHQCEVAIVILQSNDDAPRLGAVLFLCGLPGHLNSMYLHRVICLGCDQMLLLLSQVLQKLKSFTGEPRKWCDVVQLLYFFLTTSPSQSV